jgi:8-oxo-dGDP phosphatase
VTDCPDLADRPERWAIRESVRTFDTGRVISVRRDRVAASTGDSFTRDVVMHPGAVGVIALDQDDRMLLVAQYRHSVGHRLLEPPAGLLDVPDEDPLAAAQRELLEEGHVRAADWRVLVDAFSSPGMSDEALRIYLARDLSPVADSDRFVGQHEEADLPVCWAALDDVVGAILTGELHNPILIMGALACASTRGARFGVLRQADVDWQARENLPHH